MKNIKNEFDCVINNIKKPIANKQETHRNAEYITKTAGLWVNEVMIRFKAIYPNYNYVFKDPAVEKGYKKELIELFVENDILTEQHVFSGLKACRYDESIYPPKAYAFVKMCMGTEGGFECPDPHNTLKAVQAWHSMKNMNSSNLKQPTHLVRSLERTISWVGMQDAKMPHALALLNEAYSKLMLAGYKEPTVTDAVRLETTETVTERMSDEKREELAKVKITNSDWLDMKRALKARRKKEVSA